MNRHSASPPASTSGPNERHRRDRSEAGATEHLGARFAAGDDDALRAVIASYGGPVRTLARSMVAEPELVAEIVQQTFIKAWKAAGSFQPSRELAPWIYAIARRTAIDVLRREKQQTRGDHEPEVDFAVEGASFETTWERFEVRRALDLLPPGEREVIHMSHFVGIPHREIAERLDLPIGTVKSRANRALKKLALALGHLDDHTMSVAPGRVA